MNHKMKEHIEAFLPEIVSLRRDIHAYTETGFGEKRTADLAAAYLQKHGIEVTRGLGKTGLVGTLRLGTSKKCIGLRAELDALPMREETNLPYACKTGAAMHACGHDGHTGILLAAARYLSESRNFSGTVHFIFQPAEEGLGGAKAMIKDGLFERFPCDAVYAMHNWPGLEAGKIACNCGAQMAGADTVFITLAGRGAHGAQPEKGIDIMVAAASLILALQSIISRNIAPRDTALITVGQLEGGTAPNIIPEKLRLGLAVRCFSARTRRLVLDRIVALAKAQAASFGATAEVEIKQICAPLVNTEAETDYMRAAAEKLFGEKQVIGNFSPIMASEDFAFMLEKCKGSFIFIDNGDTPPVHNPHYDFNDSIILPGAMLWGALAAEYLQEG